MRLPFQKRLKLLILEVTSRCNARCLTCQVWKRPADGELSLSELEELFKNKVLKELYFFYLTGGEPFLRTDLPEIINLASASLKIPVNTLSNGLEPERIRDLVQKMNPKPVVDFSLNGPEELHDYTRGVKGNFKKLLKTREYLLQLGMRPNFNFTISSYSWQQIKWTRDFAQNLDTLLFFAVVRPLKRLLADDLDLKYFSLEEKSEILSMLPESLFKKVLAAFFNENHYFTCRAGRDLITISCRGEVYPCDNFSPELYLGNIREQPLDKLLSSCRAGEVLNYIDNGKCQPCPACLQVAMTSLKYGGKLTDASAFPIGYEGDLKKLLLFPFRFLKRKFSTPQKMREY